MYKLILFDSNIVPEHAHLNVNMKPYKSKVILVLSDSHG
jgi:hypothetical protein